MLIAARKAAGLSQVELAARLGKQQRFISLIERSQRRVDIFEFYAIAIALGREPVGLYAEIVAGLPAQVTI